MGGCLDKTLNRIYGDSDTRDEDGQRYSKCPLITIAILCAVLILGYILSVVSAKGLIPEGWLIFGAIISAISILVSEMLLFIAIIRENRYRLMRRFETVETGVFTSETSLNAGNEHETIPESMERSSRLRMQAHNSVDASSQTDNTLTLTAPEPSSSQNLKSEILTPENVFRTGEREIKSDVIKDITKPDEALNASGSISTESEHNPDKDNIDIFAALINQKAQRNNPSSESSSSPTFVEEKGIKSIHIDNETFPIQKDVLQNVEHMVNQEVVIDDIHNQGLIFEQGNPDVDPMPQNVFNEQLVENVEIGAPLQNPDIANIVQENVGAELHENIQNDPPEIQPNILQHNENINPAPLQNLEQLVEGNAQNDGLPIHGHIINIPNNAFEVQNHENANPGAEEPLNQEPVQQFPPFHFAHFFAQLLNNDIDLENILGHGHVHGNGHVEQPIGHVHGNGNVELNGHGNDHVEQLNGHVHENGNVELNGHGNDYVEQLNGHVHENGNVELNAHVQQPNDFQNINFGNQLVIDIPPNPLPVMAVGQGILQINNIPPEQQNIQIFAQNMAYNLIHGVVDNIPFIEEEQEAVQPNIPLVEEEQEAVQPNIPLVEEEQVAVQQNIPLGEEEQEAGQENIPLVEGAVQLNIDDETNNEAAKELEMETSQSSDSSQDNME